jgi:TonB family protein
LARALGSIENHGVLREGSTVHAASLSGLGTKGMLPQNAATASTPSAPAVAGQLEPREIQRVVRTASGDVKRCYQRELAKNPKLEGKLVLNWTIARNGTVSQIKVAESLHADVDACIIKVLRALQYPAPLNHVVNVTFPFVFTHSG